jgi:hypothetical protein
MQRPGTAAIPRRLAHDGWDPEIEPPTRETVERIQAWLEEVFRAKGKPVTFEYTIDELLAAWRPRMRFDEHLKEWWGPPSRNGSEMASMCLDSYSTDRASECR